MEINKILRNSIVIGLFLVPFIPFLVFSTMFFPFITGKGFAFRILMEILFAGWLILLMRDSSYLPKKTIILQALIAFISVIFLADLFGVNPFKSFWSNFERMEGFISLIHLLAYFILISSVFTEKIWEKYFMTWFGSGVFLSIYGLMQLAGKFVVNQGGVRLDATFGNATYFAGHMLFLVFLAAFYFFRQTKGSRWMYSSLVALFAFMIYETATRGTTLGLIGGTFVASIVYSYFVGGERGKKIAMWTSGGILALVLLFAVVKDTQFVQGSPVLSRFTSLAPSQIMKEPRFVIWGMALQGFKERPILGWGQENFNYVFNKYYSVKVWTQEQWFDRAHNVFFDWLIAGGILGLLSYLAIFVSAFYTLWKLRTNRGFSLTDKAILTGLLSAYFFHIFFVFDNLISSIMFLTVIAFINHENLEFGEDEVSVPKRKQPIIDDELLSYISISVIFVSLIFSLYFLNWKPMSASETLIDALKAGSDGSAAVEAFEHGLSMKTFGITEIREQLVQGASSLRSDSKADSSGKEKIFRKAVEEIENQIKWLPNDTRYEVFYASLLSTYGFHAEALKHFERALELSPNKQSIMAGIISSYVNQGSPEKGLEMAKRMLELSPKNRDSIIIYAATNVYSNKIAEAKKILKEGLEDGIVMDNRLINAYAAVKEYNELIKIWQKMVDGSPDNIQYKMALSASYMANGNRAKSIEILEEIKKIKPDPETIKQMDYYIGEIGAGRNP